MKIKQPKFKLGEIVVAKNDSVLSAYAQGQIVRAEWDKFWEYRIVFGEDVESYRWIKESEIIKLED